MSHCSNCNTRSSGCSGWNNDHANRSGCWNNCNTCNTCGDWNTWNTWSNCNAWNNWGNWALTNWVNGQQTWQQGGAACNRWAQPIVSSPAQFANLAQFSSAGTENGATLVIHKIVLDACGNQSCTPRTFSLRITGPSYPCGEVFHLRAGSCTELDEPLVITGLEPGTYCIEEVHTCQNEYISTFTGPVCGREVTVTNGYYPTVITIVSRKRLCRLCHKHGCGC